MNSELAEEVIRMVEDDCRKHRWATPDQINGMLADLTNLMEAAKALTAERDELREALREYAEMLHQTERRAWSNVSFAECSDEECIRARKLIGE